MSHPDQLTLEESISDLHALVDRFALHCQNDKLKNPEHWPECLSSGEWFEQLLAYSNSNIDVGPDISMLQGGHSPDSPVKKTCP